MVVKRILPLLTFAVFALALSSSTPVIGQQLPEFKHHVKVRVTADQNILGPIKSHINRELRSLGDVELVNDGYSWIIEITTIGSGIYVLVLKKFNNQNVFKKVPADDLYHIKGRWLGRVSKGSLKQVCRKIVTRFNHELLEKERETNRIFWDSLGPKPGKK